MKLSLTTQIKEHFKKITTKEVKKFEFSPENASKENMMQNGSTVIKKMKLT